MGFFSRVFNSIARVVRSGWEIAKDVARKAVGWMAEKAEQFVGGVKKAWQTVKPYISNIQILLRNAAKTMPLPWLRMALSLLDKALEVLIGFENSPLAKRVDAAISWAILLAKRWHNSTQASESSRAAENEQKEDRLNEEELDLARRHQESFRDAENDTAFEAHRHNLELASAINDYEIAKADLANAIDAAPADFEHYLRLRATQKLLNMIDKKFRAAKSVEDLSADDLFLVRIASNLIKENPDLSQAAAQRLDIILNERYGKNLTPFVFEDLIASWAKRAESMKEQWQVNNRAHAKDKMLLNRLNIAKKVQGELSAEESAELAQLETDVPAQKQALDDLSTKQYDLERYVGAAEGFLQLLEKTPEQLEQEDRAYLIDDGAHVGKLLIECAEHDKPFSSLSADDKALINDYANIFQKESKERMKALLEVMA